MSATVQEADPAVRELAHWRRSRPTVPEALASLLGTVIVALFLLTFVLQPYLIPSASMERTLLVGDFLLVNKQIYAPSDWFARRFLPYRAVRRGDIVIFHAPDDPARYYVKRVIGMPGDHLRIAGKRVYVNGTALDEPYAVFDSAPAGASAEDFPARVYTDPNVDPAWWRRMQRLTRDGELTVPPQQYFVLGDNRDDSRDSRDWGFVPRQAIVARPLFIYFSLSQPPAHGAQQAPDDRLGHEKVLSARISGFARWNRIFHVVH
ncbi:MAG: signal peptidase I [Terracidiphilus sp.]